MFDADALLRLIRWVRPDLRAPILRHFVAPEPGDADSGERTGWLTEFAEPRLTAMLDEVYQPAWDELPDVALEEPNYTFYPGRDLALLRRAERRATKQ